MATAPAVGSEDLLACTKCGHQVAGKAKFCPSCGVELQSTERPQAVDSIRLNRVEIWSLPKLAAGQHLDLKAIRVPYESLYLAIVCLPSVLAAIFIGCLAIGQQWEILGAVISAILFLTMIAWITWKLTFAFMLGNAIRVGPAQFPQIYNLVTEASQILGITPPTVLISQGHGIFEVFVAKRFSRRSLLIITSNMMDDLTENGSSRELMFFAGRQLGLIANGHFRFWPLKHVLGQFAPFFYSAWQRRSHMTADRLGLLVAGDLHAAEQALFIITAGSGIAVNTNVMALKEQRTDLFESLWSWIRLGLSNYPYMIDRIILLRDFANDAAKRGIQGNAPVAIGALPIAHRRLRALPLMIVHGHDSRTRLELENFLLRRFPNVTPVAMIDETDAAHTLPEKFERVAAEVKGAVALLTPDDLVLTGKTNTESRARQNVVVEIGWFWGHLGRTRCLLLVKGQLELPSD